MLPGVGLEPTSQHPVFAVLESFPHQAHVFASSEDVVWFQWLLWELGVPSAPIPLSQGRWRSQSWQSHCPGLGQEGLCVVAEEPSGVGGGRSRGWGLSPSGILSFCDGASPGKASHASHQRGISPALKSREDDLRN